MSDDSVYPEAAMPGTPPTDEQFIAVVKDAFAKSERFRDPIQKKWNYHFRLLNGSPKSDFDARTWRTNRFVNMMSVAATIIKSRFYQGMPVGTVEGRTAQAQINEDNMNSVLLYDQERAKLEVTLGDVISDGVDFACGLMKQGWRTETTDNLPRTAGFLAKMISAIRKFIPKFKESAILYDGPTFQWVDPWSFRWDPNGTDIDDCSWVGEATEQTAYQIRKDPSVDPEVIQRIRGFERLAKSVKKKSDFEERMLALGLTKVEANRFYGKVKDGLHEVAEYWGAYDIDGDGIEEEVRGLVIDWMFVGYLEENPYWHGKKPYSKWAFNSIPGFFVGRSLSDQAAESQEEINDMTNQGGDVRKLTAKPLIFMNLGADVEPEAVTWAPGAIIPRERPTDIEVFQPDISALGAILEMKKEEREIFQLLTGMNDVSIGQQDVGIADNTATGAAIAQEQTELRYKNAAIGLDLFMERNGEMLIWNEQQFRNRTDSVPVRDDMGKLTYQKIAPKDLSGLFSYRIVSSSLSMQSPTSKVNSLMKVLSIIQNNPQYNINPLIDKVVLELGVDPATIKTVQQGSQDLDKVQQFASLPPDIQQKELSKMSPQDQELMMKAMQNIPNQPQNASPQGNANPGQIAPPDPVQIGAPQGAVGTPAPNPGMGTAA